MVEFVDIVKNPAIIIKLSRPMNARAVKIVFHLFPYPLPLFVIRLIQV